MAEVNINILVQSWVRRAQLQTDPMAWLVGINGQAVDAMAAGDVFVTLLGAEGANSSQVQQYNASQLVQLTELALQRLEALAAAGPLGLPDIGAVRYGAFGFINQINRDA